MISSDERLETFGKVWSEVERMYAMLHPGNVPEIAERLSYYAKKGVPIIEISGTDAAVIGDITSPSVNSDEESRQLRIYPFVANDVHSGPVGARLVREISLASYGPLSHIVMVNLDAEETLPFLAFCLLHEFGHAHAAEKDGRAFKKSTRSSDERIAEEVVMWTVDAKVTLAIGGQHYQETVEFLLQRIKNEQLEKGEYFSWANQGFALNDCFGPPTTHLAWINREKSFRIYCQLLAAERFLDHSAAREHKFATMENYYKERYDQDSKQ